jgi:hypothetical protein
LGAAVQAVPEVVASRAVEAAALVLVSLAAAA